MILSYSGLTAPPMAFPDYAAFSRSVALIGDSLVYDSEFEWKGVSWTDAKGLPLSVGFATGQGITADSVGGGSLEYRASDKHLRWTAPSDTAGPWTPMFAGWNLLESATPGKGVRIGVRSMLGLPGTNQTVVTSVTGPSQNAWKAQGFGARLFHMLRWPAAAPKYLGLGGNTTDQVIEQLPWLEAEASGIGYDIINIGTNDVSAATPSATIIANMEVIFAARRALGRRLILMGMPARWGVNASTPLTSAQQVIHEEVNAFLANYAAANDGIFVDAYLVTRDGGFTDRRPAAGMLRDTVHYSDLGAQMVGAAAVAAVSPVTGFGPRRAAGSAGNLLAATGYMDGTAGALGAGASGVVPTGWNIKRVSGSDVTVVASVADRVDGTEGRWMAMQVSAASGGQIIQAEGTNMTLAALGLSVGDTVFIEAELDISGVSGGLVECDIFCLFNGTSPLSSIRTLVSTGTSHRQAAEASVRRSPPMKIPSGTTGIRFYVWVRTQGAAAATVKIASAAIVKVG